MRYWLLLLLLPAPVFAALTVTDRGTGSSNASTSTLACSPTSTIAVGSMGILAFAGDNGQSGAVANVPTSITDSVGNTWIRKLWWSGGGAVASSVEIAIYTSILTTQLTSSDNVTINFTGAITAKCYTFTEAAPAGGKTVISGFAAASAGAAVTTQSIIAKGPPIGSLVLGLSGIEGADSFVGDSDTLAGNWSTKQSTGVGSGTSGMAICTQWKVVTASGNQTFNPTWTSADADSGCIIATEADPKLRLVGALNGTEASTTLTFTTPLAQGSMGVLCFSADNAGVSGTTANIPTSITDSKSNVWTLRQTTIVSGGGVNNGNESGIYTSALTSAIANGDTAVITYQAASVTSKAWAVWEFPTQTTYVTGGTTTATSASPTITTTSIANGDTLVAMMGWEGTETSVADADSLNGSWSSPQASAASGTSATLDTGISSQYKTVTSAGAQTYNPTLTSSDLTLLWAEIAVPAPATSARLPTHPSIPTLATP